MSYDRISELPDYLITQILSYLPTKDSVKTSVLSTRWRNLWLHVPALDLHSNDFNCFSKLATKKFNRLMKFNRESHLQKFKIKFDKSFVDLCPISHWIAKAVGHRAFQHLAVEVKNPMCFTGFIPVNIYKSKTLVSLKLQHVGLKNPKFVVSLPCLKVMHLENVYYVTDGPLIMEKLISGCPVLEDLNVVRYHYDFLKNLRVMSQSLKIFRLIFHSRMDNSDYAVEIDAPRLKYMSFGDSQSDRIVVKNLNSLHKIDIDTEFNAKPHSRRPFESDILRKRDLIRKFLTGVSNVKHLIISEPTLEVLYRYSKLELIPEFHNLSHFQAAFSSSSLPLLPVFLESCSNLENLILDFSVSTEPEQEINLTNMPQCLISTLERIEIKKLNLWRGTGIKLANYFLVNSAVLKKLNLNDSQMTNQEIDFYKNHFTLIKLSRKCQVCFD